MLTDERLERLLRDAHAVDEVERAVRVPPDRAVVRRLAWGIAAAAVVAIAALPAVMRSRSNPGPLQPAPVADRPAEASLLLAVYQNDAGLLSCVNWSADALKGRKVSAISAEELTRLGLTLSCDPSAARILVMGLEGPVTALPTSDDRAHAVAQCITSTGPCAAGAFDPQTCAAAGCLGQEVKVRIESVALR